MLKHCVEKFASRLTLDAMLFQGKNNLEWLHLVFSMKVLFSHATNHLEFEFIFLRLLSNFLGSPLFYL
jgi:hypothetical protein